MAGRQGHPVHFAGIPGADDHAARIGIVPDGVDHLRELVDGTAVGGRPAAPLVAVHRPQVAVLICPLVPDGDSVVLEILDVGIAGDEPEKLVDDGLQVHLLGSEEREAFAQVETHLVAEHALRADPRAVFLDDALAADAPEQVEILFHSTVLKAKMMASWYTSPGRRTVLGYSGLLGESGKCWHSRATP